MDQSAYLALLDRTEQETVSVAARFDDAALQQRADGKWSPLEVLEHCCLTEALVAGLLQRPSAEHHDGETVHGSDKLYHLMVNKRAFKIAAPERLHPKGAFAGRAAFEERFRSQRAALREAIEGGILPLDNRLFPHPVLGNMTVTDWLYFLVHHTQRHLEDLKERIPATV
ncbi:MAG: DinB family protein [Chitinophagaceae bacterium]|nr:MAG: DinB family protein [Chitinophagaceae bacterium]